MDEEATTPETASAGPRRLRRLLVGCALIVLALVAAAAVFLPRLVDVNRYRPRLEALARDAVGREVRLGELGLSVLPGVAVTVDGVEVGAVEQPLLSVGEVRVGAALLPLLSGRLQVDRVVLSEPVVAVQRREDGSIDLLDLLEAREGPADGQGRVSVRSVRVHGGRILFRDAHASPGTVIEHELHDVEADVRGIGAEGGPLRTSLRAVLPTAGGGTLHWEGSLSPKARTLDGRLELTSLDLPTLAPYLPRTESLRGLVGRVSVDLEGARTRDGGARLEGRISAEGLGAPFAGTARPADLSAEVLLTRSADGELLAERLDVSSGSSTLALRGSVGESDDEGLAVTAELARTRLRLQDLNRLAGIFGASVPTAGLASDSATVAGRVRLAFAGEQRRLRRVDVDGLTVSETSLVLVRAADGRVSLPGPRRAEREGRAEGSTPEITVRNVQLRDVDVRFEDRAVADEPVITQLTDLAVDVGSWSAGREAPVTLSAKLAGGSVDVEGKVGPARGEALPVDVRVRLRGLDAGALAPYLARHAGMNVESGTLGLDSRITGSTEDTLAIAGALDLTAARVKLAGRDPLTLDLRIDHDLALERGGDRVRLEALTIRLPGGPFSVDGSIELPEGAPPRFDVGTRGTARLTTDDIGFLTALLGTKKVRFTLDAEDPIELDARLVKSAGGFEARGRAGLRKLVLRHPLLGEQPLLVAAADVAMEGERVALDGLKMRLGETDLTGRLSFVGFDRHRVEFDFTSNEANLDELFSFLTRVREGVASDGGERRGPDHLGKTKATGRLRVGRARLGEVEFTDFSADLQLENRELTVAPATLTLYGGTARGDVAAHLAEKPARYEAKVQLQDVELQPLLTAGLGFDQVSGKAAGRLDLAGLAGPAAQSVPAARGGGSLKARDGRIGGLNILAALKKADVFGERSLGELGARLAEEGTTYQSLDADYLLADGVLRLERAVADTPDMRVTGKGPVNLVRKQLDLELDVIFNQELSQRMREEGSRAAQLFWNSRRDAVQFPFKLVGDLAKPRAVIDWQGAMAQAAQRELENRLGDLLGGGRREPEPEPTAPREESSPREPGAGTPQAPAASADAARAEIAEARLRGNFLAPDLKLGIRVQGRDLASVRIVVRDDSGQEVHVEDAAFATDIAARSGDQALELEWRLDGKRFVGIRKLVVEVTPRTRAGTFGATVESSVKPLKLF